MSKPTLFKLPRTKADFQNAGSALFASSLFSISLTSPLKLLGSSGPYGTAAFAISGAIFTYGYYNSKGIDVKNKDDIKKFALYAAVAAGTAYLASNLTHYLLFTALCTVGLGTDLSCTACYSGVVFTIAMAALNYKLKDWQKTDQGADVKKDEKSAGVEKNEPTEKNNYQPIFLLSKTAEYIVDFISNYKDSITKKTALTIN